MSEHLISFLLSPQGAIRHRLATPGLWYKPELWFHVVSSFQERSGKEKALF